MKKGKPKYDSYWATSREVTSVGRAGDYFLEYNPHIGMWRINHNSGKIERKYMGYSPHYKAKVREMHHANDSARANGTD